MKKSGSQALNRRSQARISGRVGLQVVAVQVQVLGGDPPAHLLGAVLVDAVVGAEAFVAVHVEDGDEHQGHPVQQLRRQCPVLRPCPAAASCPRPCRRISPAWMQAWTSSTTWSVRPGGRRRRTGPPGRRPPAAGRDPGDWSRRMSIRAGGWRPPGRRTRPWSRRRWVCAVPPDFSKGSPGPRLHRPTGPTR